MTTDRYPYWVCTDCYYAHHGLDDDDEHSPDREPLGLVPEEAEVYDWTCSNHFYGQDVTPDNGDATTCDHCGGLGWENGITEFTWSSCDGCGSHLGGSRHRLAVDISREETRHG